MKLSDHKDLKEAILSLTEKEKDKLLLRLVAKDKILTEQLHFQLLEDESDLQQRVALIEGKIAYFADFLLRFDRNDAEDISYYIRTILFDINHFYKVTKSDYNDIALRISLFHLVANHIHHIKDIHSIKYHKLTVYFCKSITTLLTKFKKLHEDIQFDFRKDFEFILEQLLNSPMQHEAKAKQIALD